MIKKRTINLEVSVTYEYDSSSYKHLNDTLTDACACDMVLNHSDEDADYIRITSVKSRFVGDWNEHTI